MKRQHPTELDIAKTLFYGCHICGTGEGIWSYARNHIYGYFPCRECYNQHRYWKVNDESALFYHLSRHYRDNTDRNYYGFLHDKFCREQFGKVRNEKGIHEPSAYCNDCKKVLPLFDMQLSQGKIRVKDGIIHGGFRCFDCQFKLWHQMRTCSFCHREIYYTAGETQDNRSFFNVCSSCDNIRLSDRQIRERRHSEKQEAAAIQAFRKYAFSLLVKAGIENPDDDIVEIKVAQITMKRTVKQLKEWRRGNESNHADVSGKQRADEANYERGIQAGTSLGSAA